MTVKKYQPGDLKVNAKRLNDTLHETCEWGAAHRYGDQPTQTGMARLALSDTDRQVRDWFVAEMKKINCTVLVDEMGSLFAIRKGKKDGPPTAMGSHLDTQPTGGRYDGILGVQSAVEAMRVLHENNVETEYPVCAIDWTNEEGARFPKSLHASAVWAHDETLADAHALADVADPSISTIMELERIGYKGETKCSYEANPIAAHFELHIEQGPVLENEGLKVGVVQGGQGYNWFNIKIKGRDSHAGTTPLDLRADPLQAAAQIIVMSKQVAVKHGGLATTGIFHLLPGSVNTIPHTVEFSLDIRHTQDAVLAAMEKEIRTAADAIVAGDDYTACTIEWTYLYGHSVVQFHPACISAVRQAAEYAVGKDQTRDIVSGAGHDSCATARHVPTAMIFIPSEKGLSHNPHEYSTPEDCALGAQVLLDAVMLYDSQRTA